MNKSEENGKWTKDNVGQVIVIGAGNSGRDDAFRAMLEYMTKPLFIPYYPQDAVVTFHSLNERQFCNKPRSIESSYFILNT